MKGLLDWSLIPQSLYAQDVADMAGDCLRRYGPEEWRAVNHYIRSLALKYWLEWDRRQIYAVSANKM